jgi:collagen type III alpha
MATVSEKSRQTYADADEFIQFQIQQARSRIKSTDLLTAVVLTGLLMVSYILVFTLFDHWIVDGGFSAWTRAAMLAVVVTLCGGILFRYVLRPWFRSIHPLYAARMLDKNSEGLQGSLLTLIDLQAGGRLSDESIQRTLEKRAAVRLADVHVDEVIDRRLLVRLSIAMFIVTAIMCLYAVFSPKAISLLRPLTVADASVATRTVIDTVKPGNSRLPGGSQLEILADISGVIPKDVQVLFTTEDRRFVDEPLPMRATDDPHRFRAMMIGDGDRGLRQNFTYHVVAGDAVSETFSIVVDQPPTAQVVEVRYKYPDYMAMPDRTDASGTIEAWEGSTVTILAESSVPVQTAVLQLSDEASFKAKGEELRMEIIDRSLKTQLTLNAREDGSLPKFYRIQVFDADGHSDPDPVVYAMEIRRDQAPVVKLHDPTRDLQVPSNAIIPLLVEAEDPDFVLRSVTLHYMVNGKPIQPAEILLDTAKTVMPKRWTGTHQFRLEPLKLKAGDVVTYHVQARDNRPPLGSQGRTGDLNLQIQGEVSDADVQEQLKQDLEMQKQQKKDLTDQNDDARNIDGNEQPGEQPNDPMLPEQGPDSETPATDPPEVGADDAGKTADGTNSQPNGQKQEGSEAAKGGIEKSSAERNAPPTQSGSKDGSESSARRLDDDEALQKIIEQMNRRREQGGNTDAEDEQPGNEPNADQDQKAKEPNAGTERPKAAEGGKSDDSREKNDSSSESTATKEQQSSDDQPKRDDTGNDGDKESPSSDADATKPEGDNAADQAAESVPDDKAADNDSKMSDSGADDELKSKEPDQSDANTGDDSESKSSEKSNGADDTKMTDENPAQKQKSGTDNSQKETKSDPNSDTQGTQQADSSKADASKAGDKSDSKKSDDSSKEQGSKPGEKSDAKSEGQKKSDTSKGGTEKKPGGENAKSGEMSKEDKQPNDPNADSSKSGKAQDQSEKTGNANKYGDKDAAKNASSKEGQPEKGEPKNGSEKGTAGKSSDEKNANGKNSSEKTGEKSESKKSDSDNSGTNDEASKSSDGKSSDGKSSDGKSSDGKSSDGKSSEGKSSDGKSSDGKSGEGKSGEGKSGEGKSGEGKSGKGKSGKGKSGEGKSGEGKSGEGKSGEGKSGGGKSGGKPGEGKSGSAGAKGAPKGAVNGKSGAGKSSGQAPLGGSNEGGDFRADDQPGEAGNGGTSSGEPAAANDPAVDEAAAAASLALKRLEKELDRGIVDPKLLEELGWTKEELAEFKERLQKQLEERELNDQQKKERSISQKSFEEMLKSIDVKSSGKEREGRSDRDRDQQDTTNRQPVVPKRYQQWYEMYQRSISGDTKPRTR